MATVITIQAKGNTKVEIKKNLNIIDSFIKPLIATTTLALISNTNPDFNPRVYYSEISLVPKVIQDLIKTLRSDTKVNYAIRGIAYSGHLNKV